MKYDVQISEVAPQPLAAAQGHGNAQNYVQQLFALLDEVWNFLRGHPQIQHKGLNVFLYHGEDDKDLLRTDQGLPIVAGVILAGPFESAEKVVAATTPGGTVATAVHIGPYEQLSEAHAALRKWCKDNNRPIAGPSWEIYGHWDDDPDKLRTDVFYLLA
ncbi:MAG: GyrI-like domain-containing protein [Chloroflexi bacterium]|nr:GyrI-like domain-containing protein [Chloroflexota bacterium]